MDIHILEIAKQFQTEGELSAIDTFGYGHINDTYKLDYRLKGRNCQSYTLQRINHNIFKKPHLMMENIYKITTHLQKKSGLFANESRYTLSLVHTHNGDYFYKDPEGNTWRMYHFIDKAQSFETIDTPEQAYQAAKAFGQFQRNLHDLKDSELHETIPDFHNTPKRFEMLNDAIKENPMDRLQYVKEEVEFALAREEEATHLLNLHKAGKIPARITHNDTKLNNVLIDDATGKGLCVIDLDTVMPGLALYDFGDIVRTTVSPTAEDEEDLKKVTVRLPLFRAITKGFLKGAGDIFSQAELDNLVFSGKLITLEIGIRFLTDYLEGDQYFKTTKKDHNLIRARNQFQLVKCLEKTEKQLDAIVKEVIKDNG